MAARNKFLVDWDSPEYEKLFEERLSKNPELIRSLFAPGTIEEFRKLRKENRVIVAPERPAIKTKYDDGDQGEWAMYYATFRKLGLMKTHEEIAREMGSEIEKLYHLINISPDERSRVNKDPMHVIDISSGVRLSRYETIHIQTVTKMIENFFRFIEIEIPDVADPVNDEEVWQLNRERRLFILPIKPKIKYPYADSDWEDWIIYTALCRVLGISITQRQLSKEMDRSLKTVRNKFNVVLKKYRK